MSEPAAPQKDNTRHQIVRVNLLRRSSKVIDTVVGAENAERLLEFRKQNLTPAEIARGDSYTIKSCSPLGSVRRSRVHRSPRAPA